VPKPRRFKVLTDLNLNHGTPPRVQPVLGEWGPGVTMATRAKKRARWLWASAFVIVAAGLFIFGHWVYGLIMGAGS